MSFEEYGKAWITATERGDIWEPQIFDLINPGDRFHLQQLLDGGDVSIVRDVLADQLDELLLSRRPDWCPEPSELASAVSSHLGEKEVLEYGSWVWYPWSRQLVHMLPVREYLELRQSRNRYKITRQEQDRLAEKTIAIVGLSVGAASAVTLAQEGVSRRFRLADFDHISLSNLNRLHAAVANVGLSKVVVAARNMFEMDPYLDIKIWPDGLTETNVEAFLTDGGRADLLVEECDDLHIKFLVREHARACGIPVLMETNERGMLDVERFDLEPDRPVLHDLLRGLTAADLKGLTTREKVPHILQILSQEVYSQRFAPSLIEIGQTISSWPQLASGVALGAALISDTARRILLGQFTASGRYFVDLQELVRDGTQVRLHPPLTASTTVSTTMPTPLPLPEASDTLGEEGIRRLVAYGIQAPSGGNIQPWRFVYRDKTLYCRVDDSQPSTLLDFERSATYLAFGAAVENIHLAAQAAGWNCHIRVFPDLDDPGLVCALNFSRDSRLPRPDLTDFIAQRMTNRKKGSDSSLSASHVTALQQCAADNHTRLHLVTDRLQLNELGSILGACDRLRLLSQPLHQEMMSEMRWDPEEVQRTRDGIDIATLELDSTDLAGIRMARHWSHLALVQEIGGGQVFEEGARKTVASSSAIGYLTIPGNDPRSYFQGGRALQQVWLTATSFGLALQPLTSLLYLFARGERGDGAELDAGQMRTLQDLRARFSQFMPRNSNHAELLLFRLSYCAPSSNRSLRRDINSLLTFEG